MELNQAAIEWIRRAVEHIHYGEARLIISDKQIVKIITEDHKTHEQRLTNIPDSR